MAKKKWAELPTDKQKTLVEELDDKELARRYDKTPDYFARFRKFLAGIPRQTTAAKNRPHSPPKDLVISARRDLSFVEANFELFDNSIDKWRTTGSRKDLAIDVRYDPELNTGLYSDNAGGMAEEDVYKVFIPGETTNKDYHQNVIGSFGMGAKKGIFRLTCGAKVVSCTSDSHSATSEVPENWEELPNWETMDGRAASIGKGNTRIYMYKLFTLPSQTEVERLITQASRVYRLLLAGHFLNKRVTIAINGIKVTPAPDVKWADPSGAGPRTYSLEKTLPNFLNLGESLEVRATFCCGLTRTTPSGADDWGIDVFGNGRLFDENLKQEFGFGTKGLGTQTSGNRYFKGILNIEGHSFAVPWDTHKREYMAEHPVAKWLRNELYQIIKAYSGVANKFASDTILRKKYLEGTEAKKIPGVTVKTDEAIASAALPVWEYESEQQPRKKAAPPAKPTPGADINNGPKSKARLAKPRPPAEYTICFTVNATDYDDLQARFDAQSEDDIGVAIADCLTSGVAFSLAPEELTASLRLFKCDGDLGQLSDAIKEQLKKKIK